MTRRLVILTEIISPYRIPLFNTLASQPGIDLHVIFLAETDPSLRQWQIYKDEIQFSYQVLQSWRKRMGRYNMLLNLGVGTALTAAAGDLILCGGYNYLASWQALLWARSRRVPFLLWSESNVQDMRRGHALVELLKSEFLGRCSGFVVPGRSAREYLRVHKVDDAQIFNAPNAVDNDFFSAAAAAARQKGAVLRSALALPDRYILYVGRLVAEKGVFDLLSAYAKLEERTRRQIGLVYVGEGASRRQLEEQASIQHASIQPGMIRFAGFVQRDELAAYYALAEMLMLPTYSDPWGLVVNEAMACSLPVVVSRVAGCAADLVKENCNGLLTDPGDVPALAAAMEGIASNPNLRAEMGANSARLIASYSPATWSLGVSQAVGGMGTCQ
jgi:glycosyltransferase involved in cell wall biosynthesis